MGCSNLTPLEQRRFDTFEAYWRVLAERYPYFGRKAIDWDELGRQYRSSVTAVRSNVAFYRMLATMFAELDDGHVAFKVDDALMADGDGAEPRSLLEDPAFELALIDGEYRALSWPSDPYPPRHLTNEPPPVIETVEGARLVSGVASVLFRGAPGSPVEFGLRWSDGTRSRHVVSRPTEAPSGDFSLQVIPSAALDWPAEGIARLRIRTFSPTEAEKMVAGLTRALDVVVESAAGLIIDLSGNGGGQLAIGIHLARRLVTNPIQFVEDVPPEVYFGLFTVERLEVLAAEPEPPLFGGPVVVIVDGRSASAAEHVARLLQRHGAAVVGEGTRGLEAAVSRFEGPDGATLLFGERSLLDDSGRRLQDVGVTPDVAVPLRIERVLELGIEAARAEWGRQTLEEALRVLRSRGVEPADGVGSAPNVLDK